MLDTQILSSAVHSIYRPSEAGRTVSRVSVVTGPTTVFTKNSVRLRAFAGSCTVCATEDMYDMTTLF